MCLNLFFFFSPYSVDGYVRHHSISRRGSVFWVGGEAFQSTKQLVEYFKAHPLGDITLKEEVLFIIILFHQAVTLLLCTNSPYNSSIQNCPQNSDRVQLRFQFPERYIIQLFGRLLSNI